EDLFRRVGPRSQDGGACHAPATMAQLGRNVLRATPNGLCSQRNWLCASSTEGGLLGRDDLASCVVTAAAAGAVGKHRLLAVPAGDDLHRSAEVVVGSAPTITAHPGRPLLGNSHGVSLLVQLEILQLGEAGIYPVGGAPALPFVEVLAARAAETLAVLTADG